MQIHIFPTKAEMAQAAARRAAEGLRQAVAGRSAANLILATGASQFEMLACLVTQPVDWARVTVFHLDEYTGLPETHPASFRKYLKERFAAKVPGLAAFHYVNGDAADPVAECRRLGELIRRHPVDVACI
ncbi:MAG: glucosamine-6-phosphate deaminase, partial [Chloroflexi bacterium]